MSFWELLKKPDTAFTYLLTVLALVIPGLGYIYLQHPAYLTDFKELKLILLSIMFSVPLFVLGIISATFSLKKLVKKDDYRLVLLLGSLSSLLSFICAISTKSILENTVAFHVAFYGLSLLINLVWMIGCRIECA